MSNIDFINELPKRNYGNGGALGTYKDPVLVQFAEELRSNPGKWAVYPKPLSPKSANPLSNRIRNGRHTFGTGFDAAVRTGVLYVRFVGGDAL